MRSIILPYVNTTIQVFIDKIEALNYDDNVTVNIGTNGVSDAYKIPVTDATDAAALLLQINNAINSASEITVITGDPAPTTAPTGVAAVEDFGQVTINWTPLASNYSYNVYRSETAGSGYTPLGSTTVPSFIDGSVASGTTYYYVVTTFTNRGESGYSAEVSGAGDIPDAPATFAATAGYYSASLGWDAVTGSVAFPTPWYTIYQDGILVAGTYAIFIEIEGLTDGVSYEFTVTATLNNYEGDESAPDSATPDPLAAPSGFSVTPGVYSNHLAWMAVTGAERYDVFRGDATGTETFLANVLSGVVFDDTGLRYDQEYFYVVRAYAHATEGPESSEESGQPTIATFTSSTDGSTSGGIITFTGADFDPLQNGALRFGTVTTVDLPCSYINSTTLTINTPGGLTPGNVQFYYIVGGSSYTLPFLVAFT